MIDPDEIESGLRSTFYREIAARYDAMLKSKIEAVLLPKNAEDTAYIRGFVEGVRACQRLPEVFRNEIEARRKPARRGKRYG